MTESYASWKGWHGADFGRFTPEDALYFAAELHACGVASVSGMKVAELGFGNGSFAAWVRHAGGLWVGREASLQLCERASLAGFQVVDNGAHFSTAFGAGKLDLIVAFDVIEHLEIDAIRTFLREAKEALKPGGLLLFRIPSGDSPFSGGIFYGDLTHRTLLGSGAVRQLTAETGWQIFQMRSPVLPILGLGLARAVRRLAIKLTQTFAFALIRYGLMQNRDAVVSVNMVVVLKNETLPGNV